MRFTPTPVVIASIYANHYANRAKRKVINAKEYAVAHKSELVCIAVTTAVVGTTARVDGFKAGYAYANNS
jgi:hypothetical protein